MSGGGAGRGLIWRRVRAAAVPRLLCSPSDALLEEVVGDPVVPDAHTTRRGRTQCVQPRRVASFECANRKKNRPNSVLDEMWARAMVPDCLWSFIRLVPMCR